MEDAVLVGSPTEEFSLCGDQTSAMSNDSDSTFAVVPDGEKRPQPVGDSYPSLNTALIEGNIYERRSDIIEVKSFFFLIFNCALSMTKF